jgi:aryl-alcohol dehydrogenase-like predicted oxidoreductase
VDAQRANGDASALELYARAVKHKVICSVIIGARNEEQLRQNLTAAEWSLTPEQVARLDEASEQTLPYPYWHQRQFTERNPPPPPYV